MRIFKAMMATVLLAVIAFLALIPAVMGDCIDVEACERSKKMAALVVLGVAGAVWMLIMWLILRPRRAGKTKK
ncbi:MAG: hypothetical protein ABIP41_08860 [Croceibacterium sp.]